MSDLEIFYETKIRKGDESMPDFNEANPNTIDVVESSISFAIWKLKRAFYKLIESFKKLIKTIK